MTEQTATEATGLDKSRRYLRPVRATVISDDPDGVHLAVYSWLPRLDEWATGPGLCGESVQQDALPVGTVVTCPSREAYRSKYERYLAPGYNPEDDDPEALRAKLKRIRADIGRMCNCCATNREYLGRIRRELGMNLDGYPSEAGEGE